MIFVATLLVLGNKKILTSLSNTKIALDCIELTNFVTIMTDLK